MKAREYALMQHAVESGVAHGIRRWAKHREDDVEDTILRDAIDEKIVSEVMTSICEWFDFEQEEG